MVILENISYTDIKRQNRKTLLHFLELERLILRNQDFNHYQTSEKRSTVNSPK